VLHSRPPRHSSGSHDCAAIRVNARDHFSIRRLNAGIHFRALTAMSPLQYRKRLRLHAARDRMLNDGLDATSAAFKVGYGSASWFSREYKRLFGQPPVTDVKARRLADSARSARNNRADHSVGVVGKEEVIRAN
jgi:AraC-like DNA-binding protein